MPSPQRHHHVCIPSLAERPDGSWGSIDSIGLRSWKKGLGAIYRLQLGAALQERGFAIEQADDDWRWSVAGVPEKLCKFFSARRAALEEELAQAGLTSAQAPALAAAVNLNNRNAKREWSNADLTRRWQEAALGQGFRPEDVVAAARGAGRSATLEPEERSRKQQERIAAVPAVLTEHDATFSRLSLIEATANALVGTCASAEQAIEAADRLAASEQVVRLAQTRDGPVYSTPQMLAAEKALVELASRMAKSHVAAPDPSAVEDLVSAAPFNSEQRDVIRAATIGKRLVHVQGAAGTGKSTTLGAITRAWQAAGYQVVGAAVAWRAANTLGADLGIEASAIDSWLSRIDRGGEPFTGKTCLIVEESGLQSTPQALRLLEAVARSGGIVVNVGDEHQLRPVGPGHAARLIRQAIGAVELNAIVRQRETWARQAPMAFARGDACAALDAFAERGLLQMCDGPRAAVEALADRWQQLTDAFPGETVLVTAKTNAEVRALSAALRNRLRQRGLITGPDTAIEAADASGNRHTLRLAAGDRIRFLTRNDALGVINGTEARVVAVETGADEAIRISAEKDGRRFSFSPADVADTKGGARIASALAASTFAAQGMSVARHLSLISSRFDRHDAYVAASRARESSEFFIDRRALDREMEEAGPQNSRLEIDQARMAHLAARLSRTTVKTNALDLIAVERDARTRRRELPREL
jgi:ATP-dependent exoDNAse (exonuclease V) alpha subunit